MSGSTTIRLPMSKPITDLFTVDKNGVDLLFMGPTDTCVCGCQVFHALIWFDETRSIGGYFTAMVCVACSALIRGVTQDPDEAP